VGPRRYDRSRELGFGRPAPVGATPLADHPIEPLRGQLDQVTSALAEVTNLNQDLTNSKEQQSNSREASIKVRKIGGVLFRMGGNAWAGGVGQ